MALTVRIPPALICIWAGFLGLAALSYRSAFHEPKRMSYVRPAAIDDSDPAASEAFQPKQLERAAAAIRAERFPPPVWSQLAPDPALRATHLPSDAPPFSAAQVAWGAELFRSSWSEDHAACVACHEPQWGFGSGRFDGPPALLDHLNRAEYRSAQGWQKWTDRITTALTHPDEAGWNSLAEAARALATRDTTFANADPQEIVTALAAFLAIQRSSKSAWDRSTSGDAQALTPLQSKGAELFFGPARCGECHPAPSFQGEATRSLRDLELRPPYGPRGGYETLGAFLQEHAAPEFREGEARAALAAFLRALQSERAWPFVPPHAPLTSEPK